MVARNQERLEAEAVKLKDAYPFACPHNRRQAGRRALRSRFFELMPPLVDSPFSQQVKSDAKMPV